eukprot:580535-Rhodomonas_salina.1
MSVLREAQGKDNVVADSLSSRPDLAPLLEAHTYLTPSKSSSKYLEVLRSRIDAARDHLIQTQLIQAETLNKRRNPHTFAVDQQ